MRNWLVLLAAFVVALLVLGRSPDLDRVLDRPSQLAASYARATIFRPLYQAADALAETGDW